MQQTVVPGIAMWSVWQPERNFYFNSFLVTTPEGNLVIDPLALDEAGTADIAARGGVAWVAITNRDHERAARPLAARFGAKIAASALDATSLSGPVDRLLHDGDVIAGATVVGLDGLKTPGEFALHFREHATIVVGDALWGVPAGDLRLMPDDKLADPARAALSLRRLAALGPEHLLLGDGACVFGNARRALWKCLEARRDAYVNRLNLDDALWRRTKGDPAEYDCESFDIGAFIGAEKLGYQLGRLPPGSSFCPEHWHTAEEELLIVFDGAVTLSGPRGTWELKRGDLIAFPTGPSGSHKVVNHTQAPCTLLFIANTDEHDVCFYPDSQKLLVEKTGHLVRDNPSLDYYDGE